MPALGAALKLANPAIVPSFAARSGGEGNFASAGVTSDSVMPVDGVAATSLPELSLTRSGAVNPARSWSIGHLNLSQPLGSSAAHTPGRRQEPALRPAGVCASQSPHILTSAAL